MELNWFNNDTGYLAEPPPVRMISYPEFKKFYLSYNEKRTLLNLLELYISDLRRNGFNADYTVVGGNFSNIRSIGKKISILLAFTERSKLDVGSFHKYLADELKGKYNTGDAGVDFQGIMWINENATINDFEKSTSIQSLQKQHSLKNRTSKICIPVIPYKEVRVDHGN